MRGAIQVMGVKKLLSNLRKVDENLGPAVAEGLKEAGIFIRNESQAIVPVDTGALKESSYILVEGRSWKTLVKIGYSKFYAIFVHENLEASHKPGKQAKFLEAPVRDGRARILAIIRNAASNIKFKGISK